MSSPSSAAAAAPASVSAAHAAEKDAILRSTMAMLRKRYPEALAAGGESSEASTGVPAAHAFGEGEPVLVEFIRSMLMWESSQVRAAAAMARFAQHLVDVNELRICMPAELKRLLGNDDPRAEERAVRLRTALNEIFQRQHAVTLEHLPTLTKKEAREYLESIEGVPGFVSARVHLISIGGHAAPVDRRIASRLLDAGFIDAETTPDAAASMLERKIQAGEMLETYTLLQAWADDATLDKPAAAEKAASKKKPAAGGAKAPAKTTKKPSTNAKKKST